MSGEAPSSINFNNFIKQAEAELCQAQVKLEVMFEVELNVGVEVVVEGTLKLWL